jgi:hypothetical protein
VKYKAYKTPDSNRRTRKAARKATFEYNKDLHKTRSKKEKTA